MTVHEPAVVIVMSDLFATKVYFWKISEKFLPDEAISMTVTSVLYTVYPPSKSEITCVYLQRFLMLEHAPHENENLSSSLIYHKLWWRQDQNCFPLSFVFGPVFLLKVFPVYKQLIVLKSRFQAPRGMQKIHWRGERKASASIETRFVFLVLWNYIEWNFAHRLLITCIADVFLVEVSSSNPPEPEK